MGNFAGGGLYLAVGILSDIIELKRSGQGQVVDTAIVEGAASMMMQFFGMHAAGLWSEERGSNILDSGAPYYDVFTCQDGRMLAVPPIEDKFFVLMLEHLGLPNELAKLRKDRAKWPELRGLLTNAFASKPSKAWRELFDGTDCCVTEVLTMSEAATHPQFVEREVLRDNRRRHPACTRAEV